MGGCIGYERGQHGRAAGLRTHILVCVGAALTVLCGLYAALTMGLSGDPMRVSAQVISGIGFLGAGTILTRNEEKVTGLTTAAGLWTTACIGITVGLGFYWATVMALLIVMLSITVLARLEWRQKRQTMHYYLEVSGVPFINDLCDFATKNKAHIQILPAKSGLADHVGLIYSAPDEGNETEILSQLRTLNGVIIAVPHC